MPYKESYYTRLMADLLIISVIFFLTRNYYPIYSEILFSFRNISLLGFILTCWYFTAKVFKLYEEFLSRSLSREIVLDLQATIVLVVALISINFFVSRDPIYSKHFILLFLTVLVLVLPLEKYFMRWYFAKSLNGKRKVPLVIVGAGDLGMEFFHRIISKEDHGYKFVGFFDDQTRPALNGKYLGNIYELNQMLERNYEVEDVIIALPWDQHNKIRSVLDMGEKHAKRVRIIPDYFPFCKSASFSYVGSYPLISPRSIPLDETESRFFKRLFDILFSITFFLLVFSWLFPIIALLIKLTSKGPVFYKQQRWGIHKKAITCYKFRTMKADSREVDHNGKYTQASKNDPRITIVGKILRKTSLDELPQFINVLKGSMSVVGPRPHPIPLNLESKDIIERYMLRHLVKPGITGWAQIHGYRGETKNPAMMQARINHDIWYMENWNFWLDIQIIFQTMINVLKGESNAY